MPTPEADPTPPPVRITRTGLFLRLGIFFFLELAGLQIISPILNGWIGYFPAAALGTFLTALIANSIVLRIYERGRMEDVGMQWTQTSARHLGMGVAAGVAAGLFVIGLPLLAGAAKLVPATDPANQASLGRFIFVTVLLLFGVVGEELLFRGYGFQLLVARMGPWATILPFGVLFAVAHSMNISVSTLGLVNTGLWGIVLGFAFLRSGDLWLPIGLHFGWNWILPLFGVNLSGFTMVLTGFEIRWNVGEIWSGGGYGPEGSILTTVAAVALGSWLYRARIEPQPAFLLEQHNREAE